MENEERSQIEAYYQKKIESIKAKVARVINLLEQVLSFKNGMGLFAQPLMETLSVRVPHKEK
jgi:hypothetical protein